jgi:DNA polymerase IV
MKVLCLLLPHFPLRCEIARDSRTSRNASVVIRESGSQKLVLDYSPELTGLRMNMDLQQVLALHDDIRIVHADIPFYWHSFDRLLDALETISPVVEGLELGLSYMGMDGMQLMYKNDADFAGAVRESLPADFTKRIGIGPSKFLAYLAARQDGAENYYQVFTDNMAFLKDLPCDVLPVSPRILKKLREFGLRTLGQISTLSPGPLQSQFGPEGIRLWELSRGQDDTPLYPRSLEETLEEDITLNWVTTSIEALISNVESLLVKAMKKERRGRGISCLTIWTQGGDGRGWEKTVNFKEPAMDVKSALQRIKYYFENCPQPGPVEQIGIKITRLGHGVSHQKSIFSEIRAKDHLMDDIKQLDLRLGDHQVYQVKEIEPWSRIPERRYALAPLNR